MDPCPHSTVPPDRRAGDQGVGDRLRATRGNGHPTGWPSTPSIKPKPAVIGASRQERVPGEAGEDAAPRRWRTMLGNWAGGIPSPPKRASVSGCRGGTSGRQEPSVGPNPASTSGSNSRRMPAHRHRDRSPCRRPSGAGPGTPSVERMGQRHVGMDPFEAVRLSVRRRRARRNAGDPTASGWIAEHTSWVTPGKVSSSERVPPPGRRPPRGPSRPNRPRQRDRRQQPVRAGTDDDGASIHAPADDFTPRTAV